ncbi:MAG TPA: alpha/beta hydrolase [Nitrosomonas halophila]|nr:alpha/beta hydrolase [Nitrosomonas halophila]
MSWKHLFVPTLTESGKPQGHHRLAYTDWGDPKNEHVVVCVHGLTRNCRDFDFLAAALQQDFRVICIDMVGRGRSDWLKHPLDYNSPLVYLSDVENMLRHVHTQAPGRMQLYWVGVSMGGLIGMMLAARPHLPVDFNALVISDIGPFIPTWILRRFADYVGKDPRFDSLDQMQAYMKSISRSCGDLSDAQWHHLAKYGARDYADGTVGFRYDPAISISFQPDIAQDIDLWPHWDRLALPTLVLRGEQSDLLPPAMASEMQLRGPKADVVELPGIGHAPMLMDSREIGLIRNFLLKFKSHN